MFHHANGFESPDGLALTVDTCMADQIDFGASLERHFGSAEGRTHAWRVRLDLAAAPGDPAAVAAQRLGDRVVDFPTVAASVAGRRHAHVYAAGAAVCDPVAWGPFQAVVKLSADPAAGGAPREVAAWAPGPRCFVGEPVFAPRRGGDGGEDDGYVLTSVQDVGLNTTSLVVLDARRIADGPVAAIRLRAPLGYGLHGFFEPGLVYGGLTVGDAV